MKYTNKTCNCLALDDDHELDCKECAELYNDDDELCQNCNGSGEGQYDGSRCWVCKGSGVDNSNSEQSYRDFKAEQLQEFDRTEARAINGGY